MYLNRLHIMIVLLLGFFISLNSCAPKVLRDLKKTSLKETVSLPSLINYTVEGQANYRCKIEAFDQHISGIMIFKKIKEKDRVVVITDFGLKVIDISFADDGSYVINHIMKHLDYEFLRESFALNISMLRHKEIPMDAYEYENSEYKIYSLASDLFFQKNQQTTKVERYRGNNKLIARAIVQEDNIIDIQQFNPRINMKLIPIN